MRLHIVLTFLMFSLPVSAQLWEVVQGLKTGDRVAIVDTAGQEHKGLFAGASPAAISVETAKGQEAIERPQVRRVQVRSRSRRVRNVLIGVAIGVAVGVVVDQTAGTYLRNESGESGGTRAVSYVAPIALFGGIGAALPGWRTVYRVR